MTLARTSLRWVFSGLAAAVALLAGVLALAENASQTPSALFAAEALPLANPDLDFARGVVGTPNRAAQLAEAAARTDAAQAIAPRRILTTLVKMDVEVARNGGRLDDQARYLLAKSYAMSPLDLTYGFNRLAFAYNHWGELTPSLRASALRELKCLATLPARLERLPSQVVDRTGSFAATLSVNMAQRNSPTCIIPATND